VLFRSVDEKNDQLKEFEAKEFKLQELNKEIHLLEHQVKELQQQFIKVSENLLYKDFGKKYEELIQMLQELDYSKEEIASKKAKFEQKENIIKKQIQELDIDIITIRINHKKLQEILLDQENLNKEFKDLIANKALTGCELREITTLIKRLEDEYIELKKKNDEEGIRLLSNINQATVSLKLKVEEERQLKEVIKEKQQEVDNLPETETINSALQTIKEKMKRYGDTMDDNIKFFKEYNKTIIEAEDNIRNSLRIIAYKETNEQSKVIVNQLKGEVKLEETADIDTIIKVLKEVINTKEAELNTLKTSLNESIIKHSSFTSVLEAVEYMKAIQGLSALIPLVEQKVLLYKTKLVELSVVVSPEEFSREVEIDMAVRIEMLRNEYFEHLQSFIQLVHEFLRLNSTSKSSMTLQREFLQNTIKELIERTNRIGEETKLIEEKISSYDEPLKNLEEAKKKINEIEAVIRLVKDISLRYSWIQRKLSELPINEGLEQYEQIEVKKESEKEELKKREQLILEELRNTERVLNDRQLLQSQIEMNISKYEVKKSVKAISIEYQQKMDERQRLVEELKKKQQIMEELKQLEGKYHESLGESKNISRIIQVQENQLATPQYKNIEGVIQFLQFQLIASDKISEAILLRHDVIEESVMIYHNKKMEQINKVIKDLWKLTYKGKDIDTIEIKSDVEKTGSRYHSFNYRIVFKNMDGTELDMRGRCSAGQKVLGSLLIRLALAEAFCVDCGVLALDEPTTNLDTENIAGLAEALADIITERAGNKNFQLIVISHDEQFIQALGGKFTEYIWKVDKDEKGYSTLKKVELKEIL
jgi:DNA repair protein RAD50